MHEQHNSQLEPVSPEFAAAEAEAGLESGERLPEKQYCIFRAGRERFCLSVSDVEEVVEWPSLTPLPMAPGFLMGIFNLRGMIVPAIDIAFTEARRPDLPPRHCVVAVVRGQAGADDLLLGIAADEVIGTYSTSEPLLVEEAPRDVPHCSGMLRQDDRLALALDVHRLLEVFPVPVI